MYVEDIGSGAGWGSLGWWWWQVTGGVAPTTAGQELHFILNNSTSRQDLIKVFTRCLVKAGTTSHRWEMLGSTQVKLSRSFSRWVGRCRSAPSGVHLTTSGTHSQTGPQPPPPASYLSHARVMQCCIPVLTNAL